MNFQTQMQETLTSLKNKGWAINDELVPRAMSEALLEQLLLHQDENNLKKSAIGQGADQQISGGIRGDFIRWIDERVPAPREVDFLCWLASLSESLNRELYLGLRSLEAHYAHYPPGAGYDKHLDCFQQDNDRAVSFVLYLNKDWKPGSGGELVVYAEDDPVKKEAEIAPIFGRFVTFLSASIHHEVKFTNRERLSVTGWLKKT